MLCPLSLFTAVEESTGTNDLPSQLSKHSCRAYPLSPGFWVRLPPVLQVRLTKSPDGVSMTTQSDHCPVFWHQASDTHHWRGQKCILPLGTNVAMGLLPDTWNCGFICAKNAGNVHPTPPPPPRVSNPDMHHGTRVTHVPWCMLGLLTNSFL